MPGSTGHKDHDLDKTIPGFLKLLGRLVSDHLRHVRYNQEMTRTGRRKHSLSNAFITSVDSLCFCIFPLLSRALSLHGLCRWKSCTLNINRISGAGHWFMVLRHVSDPEIQIIHTSGPQDGIWSLCTTDPRHIPWGCYIVYCVYVDNMLINTTWSKRDYSGSRLYSC